MCRGQGTELAVRSHRACPAHSDTTSSKPTVTIRHFVSARPDTEWRLPVFYYLEEEKKKDV